jgi:hypothetical protein
MLAILSRELAILFTVEWCQDPKDSGNPWMQGRSATTGVKESWSKCLLEARSRIVIYYKLDTSLRY